MIAYWGLSSNGITCYKILYTTLFGSDFSLWSEQNFFYFLSMREWADWRGKKQLQQLTQCRKLQIFAFCDGL